MTAPCWQGGSFDQSSESWHRVQSLLDHEPPIVRTRIARGRAQRRVRRRGFRRGRRGRRVIGFHHFFVEFKFNFEAMAGKRKREEREEEKMERKTIIRIVSEVGMDAFADLN